MTESPSVDAAILIARADKYLNTGSGEYASEIMRDMAEFIRRLPALTRPAPSSTVGERIRTSPKPTHVIRDLAASIHDAREAYLNAFGSPDAPALREKLMEVFYNDKGGFAPLLIELADRRDVALAPRSVEAPVVERHPGPWIGADAELARACAMEAIKDYGTDDADTHQRILKDGVWNDHVAVQAALAAIHSIRKFASPPPPDTAVREALKQAQAFIIATALAPPVANFEREALIAHRQTILEKIAAALPPDAGSRT